MAGERPRDQIREGGEAEEAEGEKDRGREATHITSTARERPPSRGGNEGRLKDPKKKNDYSPSIFRSIDQMIVKNGLFRISCESAVESWWRGWKRMFSRCSAIERREEKTGIDLGRDCCAGPFLGHRRAFRERFTGAVSPLL